MALSAAGRASEAVAGLGALAGVEAAEEAVEKVAA